MTKNGLRGHGPFGGRFGPTEEVVSIIIGSILTLMFFVGLVGLAVARDTDPGPTPTPAPTTGSSRQDFIAAADRICAVRRQDNADLHRRLGESSDYVKATVTTGQVMVSGLLRLERPAEDEETIGSMIGAMERSLTDVRAAFTHSTESPEFRRYLTTGAQAAADFDRRAQAYGHRVCGAP